MCRSAATALPIEYTITAAAAAVPRRGSKTILFGNMNGLCFRAGGLRSGDMKLSPRGYDVGRQQCKRLSGRLMIIRADRICIQV